MKAARQFIAWKTLERGPVRWDGSLLIRLPGSKLPGYLHLVARRQNGFAAEIHLYRCAHSAGTPTGDRPTRLTPPITSRLSLLTNHFFCNAACAAAKRATGNRNGLQLT
jgi:hypothetical protein